MSGCVPENVRPEPDLAYAWACTAAEAATRVPAAGAEAVSWTVRGWAEIALGCAVSDLPETFAGLDDTIRRAGVPVTGPYANRLRSLRRYAGDVPSGYFADDVDLAPVTPLPEKTAAACEVFATYCDGLADAIAVAARGRSPDEHLPLWTTTAHHLRWGERFRPCPGTRNYTIYYCDIDPDLVRRSWMRLPAIDVPRIILISPNGIHPTSLRQRVRQGIHNGAHLDHLETYCAHAGTPWSSSPLEFGDGLMVAEAYAMCVELLAGAECLLAGRLAEARQVYRGLVSRIGRIPGFRAWYGRRALSSSPSRALAEAAADGVVEFTTLPMLSGHYVSGSLKQIATGWSGSLLPETLAELIRRRWEEASRRFEPVSLLSHAALGLL